jgi:hypothetical protein
MADDANLTAALITAGFSFAAAIGGILWTERSKLRVAERKHAHEANMARRVLVADLSIAMATAVGNIKVILDNPDAELITIAKPAIREYAIDKLGLLTVNEIGPTVSALRSIDHHRQVLSALAEATDNELVAFSPATARNTLDTTHGLIRLCNDAIRELKAETGA